MATSSLTLTEQKSPTKTAMGFEFIDELLDQKLDSSTVWYYGTDFKTDLETHQKPNVLFIKVTRQQDKLSEVVLLLMLEDGRSFELPYHPDTLIGDEMSSWLADGLVINELQLPRRTRITYNGLLRSGVRGGMNDDVDTNTEHVRLNCIFVASTKPNIMSDISARSPWYKFRKNSNVEQADQYGSIMAEVTFENSPSKQLFLHGMRKFQWGEFYSNSISITGYDKLGNAFHVTSNQTLKKIGHVKSPDHNVYPMESLNIDVDALSTFYEGRCPEYTFQFSAGKRRYAASVKIRDNSSKTLYCDDPWNSQYDYCQLELKLNDTDGVGMLAIQKPYEESKYADVVFPKTPIAWTKYERGDRVEIEDEDLLVNILPFDDPRCHLEAVVGDKALSLAELIAIETSEFTVPKGFCVTSQAFDEHVKVNKWIEERIDELVKICNGQLSDDIEQHCEKLVRSLKRTMMLRKVRDAIVKALDDLDSENGSRNCNYAVRSSEISIDRKDTSAPGQNSSFLGIASNNVVYKVTHCWASLYTYENVMYRRQNGLPIKASMGVCVQQMINAQSAGMMFTRQPDTGNPKGMFIMSNYALGESVVSGLVEADTIVVQRNLKGLLRFESMTIGQKSQKVILNNKDGGTQYVEVSEDDKLKLSISKETSVNLAEIGMKLDRMYRSPLVIDWAVIDDQIYLLQCRLVTGLDAWTDFELAHELGSGVPSESDILTLANVGVTLPTIATPLTLSTVIRGLNIATEASYARQSLDDTYKQHIFVFNSKCFLNYTTSLLRRAENKISLKSKLTDIAVCGREINTEIINEITLKRNGGPANRLTGIKILGEVVADFCKNQLMVGKAEEIAERCRLICTTAKSSSSPKELYEQLNELLSEYFKLSTIHVHTTKCSLAAQVLVLTILAESYSEKLTLEYYQHAANLLGSCNNVDSAQVPFELKEIAEIIEQSGLMEDFKEIHPDSSETLIWLVKNCPEACEKAYNSTQIKKQSNLSQQFKGIDPSETLSWLERYCPQAYEKVKKFKEIRGHRGNQEFELMSETWSMKPEKFLSIIQSMVNATDSINKTTEFNKEVAEATPPEPTDRPKIPIKWSTRQYIISMILPWVRSTVSEREDTKDLLIQVVNMMRMGYRELADMLVGEGRLPERELVFFFTHEELAKIIDAPCPYLVRKAGKRRKLSLVLQECKYKEVNSGLPELIESTSMREPFVKGTPVCNGEAIGRACVAMNLKEASAIRPGDILITQTADIGWIPYYPLLAGYVTELGGLICHGSVVARKYGLPCIVGAENATTNFKTGEVVVLNGIAGTLEVAEEANAATC